MRFSRSDVAVSAGVLLGAAFLLYLFALDMNATSSRFGEKSLGTVIFKRLSATRKAPGGLGWERMRNNSPVYNADTLRTADASEASISFDDGTSLDVYENSMLKLDFGGPKKNLEFLSGEIGLGSSKGTTEYTISSSGGKIKIDKGAKATFSRDADKLSVELSSGGASLVRSDGSVQAIAQNQELQVDVKSGEAAIVVRPVVPLRPEPNARLLSLAGGDKAAIGFSWQPGDPARRSDAGASFRLEMARSKDFSSEETSETVVGLSRSAWLGAGTWYWRVRDASGQLSPVRKLSLDLSRPPSPVFPADGRRYEYRRLKPSVNFAWTAMEGASSYLFEVASEPSFSRPALRTRATTTSLSVDSLGEGTWYWRVSPLHSFTLLGEAPAPESRSLVVAARTAMSPPELGSPLDGSLYQSKDAAGKGLSFSWMPQAEAVSYELTVSSSADLSSPLQTTRSKQPYLTLSGEGAEALSKAGLYYWGLRWIDAEGNLSPPSSSRALRGLGDSSSLRLAFPPDGYRTADSLASNARFAWKSNLPARTIFLLARDRDFKDIAYEEESGADTVIGRAWKVGEYYWRIKVLNADGSTFALTDPWRFEIVPPFEAPVLASPDPGKILYLREHDDASFSWRAIPGADYYKATLRSAADGFGSAVFDRDFLEGAKLDYRLGDLPSGTYRLTLQAFASDSPSTTRIIGFKGDKDFAFKRIAYLKPGLPAKDGHLAGLDARHGTPVFSFIAEDAPESAEIVVSTDAQGRKVVARKSAAGGGAKLGRLDPGAYYWTALGRLAGFDISAKERFRFFVDPIPPLPAPELLGPPTGEVFDEAKLRSKKSILLAWKPVAGASRYVLIVAAPGGGKPIIARDDLGSPNFAISDLRILDRGRFDWSVEARSYDERGELEEPGIVASSFFIIDLPALPKSAPANKGKLYGL